MSCTKGSVLLLLFFMVFIKCYSQKDDKNIHSNEDLYKYLTSSIFEREAFSIKKNQNLNINLEKQFKEYRTSFLQAKTDEELYFEILKLSNIRRDSHLKMKPLFLKNYTNKVLPVKFAVVFDDNRPVFIVEQIAEGFSSKFPDLRVGDELIKVSNTNFDNLLELTKKYIPSSTNNNHYFRLAKYLSTNIYNLSKVVDFNNPTFTFKAHDNSTYSCIFSYENKCDFTFKEVEKYNDYDLVLKGNNFNTYVCKKEDILLLEWLDFEKDLPDEVDKLMEWAVENSKLKYDLIIDATHSSGGSNSIYALRRLTGKTFKITKGNLKISDITSDFITKKTKGEIDDDEIKYAKRAEIDDGTALRNWLNTQVKDSCNCNAKYSNNVIFKMKYKTYNDRVYPYETHFEGKIVALFSPRGGSQLDQFASIIRDNQLAYSIGMNTGGYSNTWEWKEQIINPNTGNVLCYFMWNIGHTIRVNGEILEGNPARVDYYFPPTKDIILNYSNLLINESVEYLRRK